LNNIVAIVVIGVFFEIKVDVNNFNVGCWVGKDFGIDIVG
jgi:hypothetical protein